MTLNQKLSASLLTDNRGDHTNSSGSSGSNLLRFYTDDAPGLEIIPMVVLVTSLCFIGFVIALHVFGEIYRHRIWWSGLTKGMMFSLEIFVAWFLGNMSTRKFLQESTGDTPSMNTGLGTYLQRWR